MSRRSPTRALAVAVFAFGLAWLDLPRRVVPEPGPVGGMAALAG